MSTTMTKSLFLAISFMLSSAKVFAVEGIPYPFGNEKNAILYFDVPYLKGEQASKNEYGIAFNSLIAAISSGKVDNVNIDPRVKKELLSSFEDIAKAQPNVLQVNFSSNFGIVYFDYFIDKESNLKAPGFLMGCKEAKDKGVVFSDQPPLNGFLIGLSSLLEESLVAKAVKCKVQTPVVSFVSGYPKPGTALVIQEKNLNNFWIKLNLATCSKAEEEMYGKIFPGTKAKLQLKQGYLALISINQSKASHCFVNKKGEKVEDAEYYNTDEAFGQIFGSPDALLDRVAELQLNERK